MQHVDKHGHAILVGSQVQIPSMPGWLIHDLPSDDVCALRNVEGSIMMVVEIDEHGYVWFGDGSKNSRWFCLRSDEIVVGS